jgi:hypothetical protein
MIRSRLSMTAGFLPSFSPLFAFFHPRGVVFALMAGFLKGAGPRKGGADFLAAFSPYSGVNVDTKWRAVFLAAYSPYNGVNVDTK